MIEKTQVPSLPKRDAMQIALHQTFNKELQQDGFTNLQAVLATIVALSAKAAEAPGLR